MMIIFNNHTIHNQNIILKTNPVILNHVIDIGFDNHRSLPISILIVNLNSVILNIGD